MSEEDCWRRKYEDDIWSREPCAECVDCESVGREGCDVDSGDEMSALSPSQKSNPKLHHQQAQLAASPSHHFIST